MDATLTSRKRSTRSSSPPGALTRSGSQLFVHRNRSGRLRPDSGPRKGGLYSGLLGSCGNSEMQESSEDDDDTTLIKDLRKKVKRDGGEPRHLTKDLRARRVYSPQSSAVASSNLIEDAFPKGSSADSDFADRKTAGLGFGSPSSEKKSGGHVDDVMVTINSDCTGRKSAELEFGLSVSAGKGGLCVDDATVEVTESPDLGISSEVRDFDRANSDSSDETVKLQDHKQFEEGNGGDCSEKINDFDEGIVLTTPPDAEIFADSKVNGDEGKGEEDLRVRDDPFARKAEKNSGEGLSRKDGQRNDSVLKSKSVLKVRPRLQGKLFKAPGSVSYRKLFPFLMDIMRDSSGAPKLGQYQKNGKAMDGQELQHPLSSQNQEASEPELKNDSFTMCETKDSKFASSQNLHESPMELDGKEVSRECSYVPSSDDKWLNESKRDPAGDSDGVKDVGNAMHNDEFTQCSIHKNNLDSAKVTNDSGCTSEQLGDLNDKFILTTPDAKIPDSSVVSVDRSKSVPQYMDRIKPMDLRTSTQENVSEGVCPKADERKDSLLKNKSVPRPRSHGKLFKAVGSVSYNRLLPFFKELTKDDSGTSKFGNGTHHNKDKADTAKRFQLPLSSQTKASLDKRKTEKSSIHGPVESNATENILFNPSNELNLEKVECVGGYPLEGQSQLDTDMLDLEENETGNTAISQSDNALVLNHVSVSNEVPRSPTISEKPDMGTHGGNKAGHVLKGVAYGSKGSNDRNGSCADEVENVSESRITMVLNRCPRIKLLKNAGSQTYKRLLPLVLDTTEYNSCALVNDHDPKHQKFLDQTPFPPISDSHWRATFERDSNDFVPMEHYTGNSDTEQQTGLNACDLDHDSSSPQSHIPGFQSSNNKRKVIQLYDEHVLLNGLCEPESSSGSLISIHLTDSPVTPLGPVVNEVTTREEEATLASSQPSINSEVKRNSSVPISSDEKEKPPETHGCSQSLSQLEVIEQLEFSGVDLKKGILKRNPRGCRGLCTCLNCASFRLHAERSFEFSRNQLLDAEEVAQDLMKELSHLRDMLQRSTDSVNQNPVFDGSQVKEACRKAFAAEQLAKGRLSDMKDDLNIHCRTTSLQRPRVRFSDHVEERVIQSRR